jgi:phosphopantothenoylcysteine synthetase/decarboxylase
VEKEKRPTDRLAVVTCGPAHAPIDAVRRITNFATGEIGTILSSHLKAHGWKVICFRGEGSSAPPPQGVDVRGFSTNASLAAALEALPSAPEAIFHAAALSDFQVAEVEGGTEAKKISSRTGGLTLHLAPAPKLLPRLRGWFPRARLVGWKYELDGTRREAIDKALAQLAEAQTDACVVNGAAFGAGFGFLLPDGGLCEFSDKHTLAAALASWDWQAGVGGNLSGQHPS